MKGGRKFWKFVSVLENGRVVELSPLNNRPSWRSAAIFPWLAKAVWECIKYLVMKAIDEICKRPVEYGVKYLLMAIGTLWVTVHVQKAVVPPLISALTPAPATQPAPPVVVITPMSIKQPALAVLPEPTEKVEHVADVTKTYEITEDVAPFFDAAVPVSNLTFYHIRLGDSVAAAENALKDQKIKYHRTDFSIILDDADHGSVIDFDASSQITSIHMDTLGAGHMPTVDKVDAYIRTHTLRGQWLWSELGSLSDNPTDIYFDSQIRSRYVQMHRNERDVYAMNIKKA